MVPALYLAAGALLVALLLYTLAPWKKAPNLPPGPPGIPLLGNILQLPTKKLFLKLHEWTATYGDLYTLNVAGKTIVVLGSATTSGDLLDRKSAVTSGRPTFIMVGICYLELLG
jgi:uncharacterized SAM-binding protein YcdF (DUF218 family)